MGLHEVPAWRDSQPSARLAGSPSGAAAVRHPLPRLQWGLLPVVRAQALRPRPARAGRGGQETGESGGAAGGAAGPSVCGQDEEVTEPLALGAQIEQIGQLLRSHRFQCSRELELQQAVYTVLREANLQVVREKHLSRRDRPDFIVGGAIAIELKIDGGLTEILRQVSRYAQLPGIQAVILVTTRQMHALQMPDCLCGKPVRVVHLGAFF